MRKTISLILTVLILWTSGSVFAAEFDFDDLFQDDLILELEEEESSYKPEEILLMSEGLEVGGTYSFSVNASRLYFEENDPRDSFSSRLGGSLFLDARPDPNFRILGKVSFSYRHSEENEDPFRLNLVELFSDFNYDNKVFFRAGKQNVKWGVGYFFSPADVINAGRIDPLKPEAEREGPVALKVHYPQRSDNYYLYLLFDDVKKPQELAIAPKVEYVLGRSELGLGAFYQKDKSPRAMVTLSSSLGDLSLFAEAVMSKGSDKKFFVGGLPVEKDDLFFKFTAGASYNHNDQEGLFNLFGALQYYYDGEGTGFGDIILKPDDKHRLACALSWNQLLNSKFSLSSLWTSNLSDRSGLVVNTLSLPSFSKISPSVGVSFNYGDKGTEFGLLGKTTTVFAAVTLGGGSF